MTTNTLTSADYVVLQKYADAGQRELYWQYLELKGDIYAKRAGEVVRNEGLSAQIANQHAESYAPANFLGEAKWDKFGVELMQNDLLARERARGNGAVDGGLSLSVKDIRTYHAETFQKFGMSQAAWTLETIIGPLIDAGNTETAQLIWNDAMGQGLEYVRAAILTNAYAFTDYEWGWMVKTAYYASQFDSENNRSNPNHIRGFEYQANTGQWIKIGMGADGSNIGASATETAQLNLDRQWRIDRLNNTARFTKDPADALNPAQYNFFPKDPDSFGSVPNGTIDNIKNFFIAGTHTVSPLILDLNNDGIQTSSLANSNVYFDFDANGHAQRTGWVDKNDGLLVLDKNNNGIIDNGLELFGNNTKLANGQTASDGFAALADIDSNHDGKIDSLDAQFNNLRIWQDKNANGITDAGELLTLTQAGVKSLNVNYNNTATSNNGNTDQQQGQYTKTDGTIGQMNDIWFAQDTARTVDQTAAATISSDIKALPNVAGFGNVSNLQTAMSRDATLKALVQSYHAAANNGASINDLQTRATAILNQWTGASNTAPNSRGEYISDARHLIALEAFMGQGFMQSAGINEGTPNPGPNAALELENAYAKLYDYVNDSLLAQTINKPLFDSVTYSWNANSNSIEVNVSQTLSLLSNQYSTNHEQGIVQMSAFARELANQGSIGQTVLEKLRLAGNSAGNEYDVILATLGLGDVKLGTANADTFNGSAGNDVLFGNAGDDTLNGGDGNDRIDGGAGNDTIDGGKGDDRIMGGAGNDSIRGRAGNDIIDGGAGNDTYNLYSTSEGNDSYVFGRGSGQDTLWSNSRADARTDYDTILLASDLSPNDISLKRNNRSLTISINGTSDSFTINEYFNDSSAVGAGLGVMDIKFANGTVWQLRDVQARTLIATSGNDTLYGIDGFGDSINGGDGNDVIVGGAGGTFLQGGNGNDEVQAGVYGGGTDADILDGGAGNDVLRGGEGSDVYRFGRGYGKDVIINVEAASVSMGDRIKLGAGISAADVTLRRLYGGNYSADQLVLSINGTSDTLTVNEYFSSGDKISNWLNSISFADGTRWSAQDIEARVKLPTAGNDYLILGVGNDLLDGGAGSDEVHGGAGNDVLHGGDGSDSLYGEAGDDVLNGGVGNDRINGDSGNDNLQGGDGADTIIGGEGDDVIEGGAGNDVFYRGLGADTYVFNRGFGFDHLVYGGAPNDGGVAGGVTSRPSKIVFGANIAPSEVVLNWDYGSSARGALEIGLKNAAGKMTDQILIDDYFIGNFVSGIEFADGTSWDYAAVMERLQSPNTGADFTAVVKGTAVGEVLNGADVGVNDYDTILAGAGNDTLNGLAGDDRLYGQDGDDTLNGGAGDDVLNGGTGVDVMTGGAGDDTYVVDNALDKIIEVSSGGTDRVQSYISYSLSNLPEIENLSLVGNTAINATGNSLRNTIVGNAANNVLDGGAGSDYLYGGQGDDTYLTDGDEVNERENEGNDTIISSVGTRYGDLAANVENLILTGTANLAGQGNVLNNNIKGNAGNNSIDGGAGADKMQGGAGDDSYVVDNVADVVVENAAEGTDIVNSSVTYALSANVENLTLTGANAVNATGNAQDNVLRGNAAANVLKGGAGNDTYYVGTGVNSYSIGAEDTVIEYANKGVDTVYSMGSYTLGANVENLVLTYGDANGTGNDLANVITGSSYDNVLSGGLGNDTLNGGSGDDVLDGGAGNDVLVGGSGNDVYVVDSAADVVTETEYDEADTVQSSVSYSIASIDAIENLTLTGANNINGTGNASNNAVLGNAGNNSLDAGAGNDTVDGGAGDDVLFGGAGTDTLIGGLGNDVLRGGLDKDVYFFAKGFGQDVLSDSGSVSYGDTYLSDEIQFGADLKVSDFVLSRVGDDLLMSVKNSADKLTVQGYFANNGQSDNAIEFIRFSDGRVWDYAAVMVVVQNGGVGSDALIFGTSNDDTLNGTINSDTINGGAGNDTIYGHGGNDIISGGDGNDTIDGGGGRDAMSGGAGSDVYAVDNIDDVITENANEGTDTVNSSVTYTLSAYIEDLNLQGAASINGTGNAQGNRIVGNGADNVIDGGAGADNMTGGSGNDTYIVDDVRDVINELFADGRDTVRTHMSYTLGSNLEDLELLGFDAVDGTGNAADNTLVGNSANNKLIGNAGNDTLVGGGGADTLIGGLGDDVYEVDSQDDVVVESANEGLDTLKSKISIVSLLANIENVMLLGSEALSAKGNAANNVMVGNSANNVLDGDVGADSLKGGLGDDTYIVDNVADLVCENAGEGVDTVRSSVTHTLSAYVENLILTGVASLNATGNDLDNHLTGNDAANVLTGGVGNDVLDGGLGADTLMGGVGDDTIASSISYDLGVVSNIENLTLTGGNAISATGNGAANVLIGNVAENTLIGGKGNDLMLGAAGNDLYVLNAGDGVDSINDFDGVIGNEDTLQINVDFASARISQVGLDLVINYGSADAVSIKNYFKEADSVVEKIKFSNNLVLGQSDVIAMVNKAPTVKAALADQYATQGMLFRFALPDGVFVDVDEGDALRYELKKSDGTALPAWLTFDAVTRTLSGTPSNSDVGNLNFTIQAIDRAGASVSSDFGLLVNNVNDAPTVEMPISSQTAKQGKVFSFQIPGNAFKDIDAGDVLSYKVLKSDGTALPSWLKFDTATGTLSGMPAGSDVGNLKFSVTATDIAGANTSSNFNLSVSAETPSAPTLNYDTLMQDHFYADASTRVIYGAGNIGDGYWVMSGDLGSNDYTFGTSKAKWILAEYDPNPSHVDTVTFTGVKTDQLWFERVGDHLNISTIGTSNEVIVGNWYVDSGYHMEKIKTGDGRTLLDSQVDNLVGAMAAFAPPSAGQTSLPANYQTALDSVIAANWQ